MWLYGEEVSPNFGHWVICAPFSALSYSNNVSLSHWTPYYRVPNRAGARQMSQRRDIFDAMVNLIDCGSVVLNS